MTPTEKQAHHIKWLKFAILLSHVDFDALTEGQRLDLRNDFQAFLHSMPGDPRHQWPLRLLKGKNAPPIVAELLGEDDVDERRGQAILKAELANLAGPNIFQFHNSVSVSLGIARIGESFAFITMPQKADDRIFALLGYHLAGAGISTSMLRRCPECQKIFLANQKPRSDRKLHCSIVCSGNAASKAYRIRQRKLPQAIRLIQQGANIDKVAKTLDLDPDWLKKQIAGKSKKPSRALKKKSG